MKFNSFLFGFLAVFFSIYTFAQAPSPTASPPPAAVAVAPIAIGATPIVLPEIVSVAAPAAPPQWAQDLIVKAQGFPLIGPYVTKVMVWAGILSSILTALVVCLLGILNALMGVLHLSGLAGLAMGVESFKNGKFMYWLSYLSMFNAKKPDSVKPAAESGKLAA